MPLKNRLVSYVIKKLSGGEFSHVELQRGINGPCFSSDGYINKVRWKQIDFSHPERWCIVEMPKVSAARDEKIFKKCCDIEGAKYDYIGAVMLPLRPEIHIKRRWYCSEACSHVWGFSLTNIFPAPALYSMVMNQGGRIVKP
jgi:hypothetical protein